MIIPNISVSISGIPKTGKTHWALGFPDPIRVFSFERGANFVATKFPNKDIEIYSFDPPLQNSIEPEPYAEALWNEIRPLYAKTCADPKVQTVVIDTATHLWEIVSTALVERLHRKNILQREYGPANKDMLWLLVNPIINGKNLVTLQYLRPRYVNDVATDEMELDGNRRTEGIVDVVMETSIKGKKFHTVIVRNRFEPEVNGYEFINGSYEDLLLALGIGE